MNKNDIKLQINNLKSKNETSSKTLSDINKQLLKLEDEYQLKINRIERYQNTQSLSSQQRCIYEERRLTLKNRTLNILNNLEEYKSEILKDIENTNCEINNLKNMYSKYEEDNQYQCSK